MSIAEFMKFRDDLRSNPHLVDYVDRRMTGSPGIIELNTALEMLVEAANAAGYDFSFAEIIMMLKRVAAQVSCNLAVAAIRPDHRRGPPPGTAMPESGAPGIITGPPVVVLQPTPWCVCAGESHTASNLSRTMDTAAHEDEGEETECDGYSLLHPF